MLLKTKLWWIALGTTFIVLLSLFFSLNFSTFSILPYSKSSQFNFQTFRESIDTGYSVASVNMDNEGAMHLKYKLSTKMEEPFTGVYFSKKDSLPPFFDVSDFNTVKVHLKSAKAKRIPLTITFDYEGFSAKQHDFQYVPSTALVDYKGEEKLVVLGAIHTETGNEVPDSSLFFLQESGFELVMTYKTWGEGYDLLKEEIQKDREGYVVKFKNGFRMKIKGEEYKRLHKILTNFSSKDIWELLRDGKPMDEFLDRVPDEFYKWVKQQVSSFEYAKYRIGEHCGKIHDYFRYGKYGDVDPEPTKKDFALHLEKCDVETFYRPILFAMWDGKPYEHIIWRIMKPKYEKPFKNDEN